MLNPVPQCFLYDTLFIRSKLEALSGDDDYYTWTYKYVKLKPELLPLKVDQGIQAVSINYTRADLFAHSVAALIGVKGNKVFLSHNLSLGTIDASKIPNDPFDIEEDIFSNVDSPGLRKQSN